MMMMMMMMMMMKSANNVDEPYFHDGRWYIQCLYRIELNTLW